ncbi:acetylcholine receptor subunit alpha-L1-like [Orbicella faveolata]|uniref:acetylcholine receptor subunit alpha-L1-like n=1 Tax=Orbicella faveolata TaxID=48498 RepID=UPI0009E31814|nr:acetylcholine receptor subunit alpha-L1-like [Orbicella faveolata]
MMLLLHLIVLILGYHEQVLGFQERALVENLLENYHEELRPLVENNSQPTAVNISLRLIQIFEMDVKKQVIITSVWLKQAWFDPELRWNKSQYGWIDEISLSPDDVWVPDTVLLNKETGISSGLMGHLARVQTLPYLIAESGEWYLERVYALRSSSKATHSNTENKSAVTYVIHIRRKVFYYFVYLIAPCMVTSFMTLILFTLPPESGERMVVGVTILLSLTVFYLLASTHIPETSEVVPLIGRYYSLTIIEIACALGLTCWVLRFHHYNTSVGKVPNWVRVYILGYIARAVLYKVPDGSSSENGSVEVQGNRDTAVSDNDGSFARRRLPREPSGITMMAERVSKKQEEENVQDEWQLAARVINRFFLVGYLVAVFLSISVIFLQVPGVLVTRPSPPTSDEE